MSKREREETPLDSSEILSIITEITKSSQSANTKKTIFRKKYPEFADKYPVLFEMATKPDFDISRLRMMLNMRDAVTDNNISQYDASAKVGKVLYDAYVKDVIPQNTPPK